MANNPREVTAHIIVEFTRNLFRRMAEKYGGAFTLNQLRVMNQVVLCHLNGRTCSVTALHEATGIPIATVSRAVCHLQTEGWVSDRRDKTDGRKRIISLGHRSLDLTPDDISLSIQWINGFGDHGRLPDVRVCQLNSLPPIIDSVPKPSNILPEF